LYRDTGTPLVATKASTLPLSSELIQIVVLVLKVVAFRGASIISCHSLVVVVVAQGCDLRLSIPFIRGEKEGEE